MCMNISINVNFVYLQVRKNLQKTHLMSKSVLLIVKKNMAVYLSHELEDETHSNASE